MGEKYSLDVIAASLHIADYLIIGFLKKERLDRASGTRRRNNDPLPIKLHSAIFNYNKTETLFVNVRVRRERTLCYCVMTDKVRQRGAIPYESWKSPKKRASNPLLPTLHS